MLQIYFNNPEFNYELRALSDETKRELDLVDELKKLAE